MKTLTLVLVVIAAFCSSSAAMAENVTLTVAPDKCVALRKGQVCYQNVRLRFEAIKKANYCIFIESQPAPLQCFTNVSTGELLYRFESDETIQINVVDAESAVVATGEVAVAWVYKRSRKRNRWRLF